MNAVEARYVPSTFSDFLGNPFIQALTDHLAWRNTSLIEALEQSDFSKLVPTASRGQRDLWLDSLPRNLFIALPQHLRLQRLVDICIRSGYVRSVQLHKQAEALRGIQEAYTRMQLTRSKEIVRFNEVKHVDRSLPVIALSALSGMGAGSSIDRILRLYPQVIRHSSLPHGEVLQLVYLKVSCRKKGSINDLCADILSALDACLDENHQAHPGTEDSNVNELTGQVAALLRSCRLGILVIEDVQNLLSRRNGRAELLTFLTGLSRKCCMPVLLSGSLVLSSFVERELASCGHVSVADTLLWQPLPRGSEQWEFLLSRLWRCNVLKDSPVIIPQEINDALYAYSQGVIDLLVQLFVLSQKAALLRTQQTGGLELLTRDDLKCVYEEAFARVQPWLAALRAADPRALSRSPDLGTLHQDCAAFAGRCSTRLYQAVQRERPYFLEGERALAALRYLHLSCSAEHQPLPPEAAAKLRHYSKAHPDADLGELIAWGVKALQQAH